MKKSLLIVSALLLAGSLHAETNLYMGDVKMEAGKTYTYNEIEGNADFGYKIDPLLTVGSDTNSDFTFSFKCTTGQILKFCGTGECFMVSESSCQDHVDAGKTWEAMLEYEDYVAASLEEIPQDITILLTLDDKSYTLILNSSESGISKIGNDAKVAFGNNMLSYSLNGPANVVVFDMQGRKVMDTIADGAGSLDLNCLDCGAYIFRVGHTSGKILVK